MFVIFFYPLYIAPFLNIAQYPVQRFCRYR